LNLWVLTLGQVGKALLLDDLAAWRRFFISDDQDAIGVSIDVILTGMGLPSREARENAKAEGKQSRTSNDAFHKSEPPP
jgi:hypothetical protein